LSTRPPLRATFRGTEPYTSYAIQCVFGAPLLCRCSGGVARPLRIHVPCYTTLFLDDGLPYSRGRGYYDAGVGADDLLLTGDPCRKGVVRPCDSRTEPGCWHLTPSSEPPNGSRLSCGRLARRRMALGRQVVPARAQPLRFRWSDQRPPSFTRLLGSEHLAPNTALSEQPIGQFWIEEGLLPDLVADIRVFGIPYDPASRS
jgi:hypothetical protein